MNRRVLAVFIIMAVLMTGCASKSALQNEALEKSYKKEIDDYNKEQEAKKPSPSLWSDASSSGSLFLDSRARHVGDIVTVNIVETVNASNSSNTKTGKDQSTSSSGSTVFGIPIPNIFGKGTKSDLKSSSSFKAQGQRAKRDAVTGTVATRVTQVLPSGNLVIEGSKELLVDGQKQTISLSGMIRAKDIAADNSVQSTAIAQAKISYTGAGNITDASSPGWFSALVSWMSPY